MAGAGAVQYGSIYSEAATLQTVLPIRKCLDLSLVIPLAMPGLSLALNRLWDSRRRGGMAVAPFRLEQGWTSNSRLTGLFTFGPPCLFALCCARPPGFLCGPPLVFLVAAPLVKGWFGT